MLPAVEQIRSVANGLSTHRCDLAPVRTLVHRLERELLPHERAEEAMLVPLVARALGGPDATAAISRTHAEIEHQVSRLHRLVNGLDTDTVQPEDVSELRRLLYGLYAVLRLHNAQEEEGLQPRTGRGPDRSGHRRPGISRGVEKIADAHTVGFKDETVIPDFTGKS